MPRGGVGGCGGQRGHRGSDGERRQDRGEQLLLHGWFLSSGVVVGSAQEGAFAGSAYVARRTEVTEWPGRRRRPRGSRRWRSTPRPATRGSRRWRPGRASPGRAAASCWCAGRRATRSRTPPWRRGQRASVVIRIRVIAWSVPIDTLPVAEPSTGSRVAVRLGGGRRCGRALDAVTSARAPSPAPAPRPTSATAATPRQQSSRPAGPSRRAAAPAPRAGGLLGRVGSCRPEGAAGAGEQSVPEGVVHQLHSTRLAATACSAAATATALVSSPRSSAVRSGCWSFIVGSSPSPGSEDSSAGPVDGSPVTLAP